MPSNSDQKPDPKGPYFALFSQHWSEGAGLPTEKLSEWTTKAFADAVKEKAKSSPDPDSVSNWRNGDILPGRRYAEAIEQVFFPTQSDEDRVRRAAMKAAWAKADEERTRRRRPAGPASYREDWIFTGTDDSELATVRLHPLKVGNSEYSIYLDASVRVGVVEYKLEGPVGGAKRVAIGLDKVHLTFSSDRYQLGKRSMFGERVSYKHITPLPDGVEICCPRRGDCLSGDLLGDEYFARLEYTGRPGSFIELTLWAIDRCFCVFRVDEKGDRQRISAEKEAVLQALVYRKKNVDKLGRVVLAAARMEAKDSK